MGPLPALEGWKIPCFSCDCLFNSFHTFAAVKQGKVDLNNIIRAVSKTGNSLLLKPKLPGKCFSEEKPKNIVFGANHCIKREEEHCLEIFACKYVQ